MFGCGHRFKSFSFTCALVRYTTVFFITIVLSGVGAGVIDNYLFIYIEELGGGKSVQGTARFVMCAAEVGRRT